MGCWSEVPRYCHYDLNIQCIYVGMQSHEIKSIDVYSQFQWELYIWRCSSGGRLQSA